MQDCSLIIWDEASMSQKTSVEVLDRTMWDLRHNNSPMGGSDVLWRLPSNLACGYKRDKSWWSQRVFENILLMALYKNIRT